MDTQRNARMFSRRSDPNTIIFETMSTWPATLPKPSTAFKGQADSNLLRSQMTSGLYRQRRRFSVELNTYTVTWLVTEDERATFRQFFRDQINHGADYFTIELPVGDGNTYTSLNARFSSGGFSESYRDFRAWTISATLECSEVAVISDTDYDLLVDFDRFELAVDDADDAANIYSAAIDAALTP